MRVCHRNFILPKPVTTTATKQPRAPTNAKLLKSGTIRPFIPVGNCASCHMDKPFNLLAKIQSAFLRAGHVSVPKPADLLCL